MQLRSGQTAPAFDVLASDGRRIRLADFLGKKIVVIYFYPKDFTRVCTAESCGFRDMYKELAERDVEVIGVSLDSDESHRRFTKQYDLPFSLISDKNKTLTRAFGALGSIRSLLGLAKRLTYVIDREGKIAGVFDGELNATPHLEGVRGLIKQLRAA